MVRRAQPRDRQRPERRRAQAPDRGAEARRPRALRQQFLDDSRKAEGESHLLRNSGRYPLCGRGDINIYAVFAEGMRTLLNDGGRAGCVLPTGIATDDTTKFFFQDVVETKSPGQPVRLRERARSSSRRPQRLQVLPLHRWPRRCGRHAEAAEFVFFAHARRGPARPGAALHALTPKTSRCSTPTPAPARSSARARRRTDQGHLPPRAGADPRGAGRPARGEPVGHHSSAAMFDMSNDSHLFRTREQLEAEGWRLDGNVFRKDRASSTCRCTRRRWSTIRPSVGDFERATD